MKKILAAVSVLALTASGAFAQLSTTPGTDQAGRSPAVGEKDSYKPNNPNRTGGGVSNPGIPGQPGAGANATDRENFNANDPSRTGSGSTVTSPKGAGPVGQTNTGK
jgi:hypothetical protein